MPKHPVVHGHPLHAMLSDLPVGLVPVAFAAAVAERAAMSRETVFAARTANVLAFGTGAAAGAAGWWDWFLMPKEHPAKKPALLHGLLNGSAVVMTGLALRKPSWRPWLLGAATLGLTVGGWIGGDLVFRHGWRVRPAEELEIITESPDGEISRRLERARGIVDEHERKETFFAGR